MPAPGTVTSSGVGHTSGTPPSSTALEPNALRIERFDLKPLFETVLGASQGPGGGKRWPIYCKTTALPALGW